MTLEFNMRDLFSSPFLFSIKNCHFRRMLNIHTEFAVSLRLLACIPLVQYTLVSCSTDTSHKECMGTILSRCAKSARGGSVKPGFFKIEGGGTHAFSNGINVLLITRPERKIYLSSPRICDQGISASVLLRDEN